MIKSFLIGLLIIVGGGYEAIKISMMLIVTNKAIPKKHNSLRLCCIVLSHAEQHEKSSLIIDQSHVDIFTAAIIFGFYQAFGSR